MKTEHTQGPWQRVSDKPFVTAFCKETDRPEIVATIYSHGGEVGEWEANAYLVAASPDLLAFAERVASWQGNEGAMSVCVWAELIRQACVIVAEAKGSK